MDNNRLFSRLRDEGGQVWGFVLKFALVAVVIGALIIQFGPVAWNHISIHGTAEDAAEEAVATYRDSRGDMEKVNRVVMELLEDRGARLVGTVDVIKGQGGQPDTISLTVRKIVNTRLIENIGYLCRLAEAVASSRKPVL